MTYPERLCQITSPYYVHYATWLFAGKRLRRQEPRPETRRFKLMFDLARGVSAPASGDGLSYECDGCSEPIYIDDDLVMTQTATDQIFNLCESCATRFGWTGKPHEYHVFAIRLYPDKPAKLMDYTLHYSLPSLFAEVLDNG